jgi:hypothetical protein
MIVVKHHVTCILNIECIVNAWGDNHKGTTLVVARSNIFFPCNLKLMG